MAARERSRSNVPWAVWTDVSRSCVSNAQNLVKLEEDEAPLLARDDARRRVRGEQPGTAGRRGTALVEPAESLRHALLRERLQEVVDHPELERLERVLLERGRQHEHRSALGADEGADQVEPGLAPPARGAGRRRRRSRCRPPTPAPAPPRAPAPSSRPPRRPPRAAKPGGARRGSCGPATRPRRRAYGAGHRPEIMPAARRSRAPALARGISTVARVPTVEPLASSAIPSRATRAPGYFSSTRRTMARSPNAPWRTSPAGAPGPLSSTTHSSLSPGAHRSADDDLTSAPTLQRSVLHRVLDQRLQEEPRQQDASRCPPRRPTRTSTTPRAAPGGWPA